MPLFHCNTKAFTHCRIFRNFFVQLSTIYLIFLKILYTFVVHNTRLETPHLIHFSFKAIKVNVQKNESSNLFTWA